ncbi:MULTISPECIES: hypothetical protein [Paracoccus]|mgnify:CR=1 FL=1|uniref:hypothetical protein n=1 Tax=Paracoccus TaxID=265 RepID=UPI00086B41E0|nr:MULTISPECIES: hypothetical protein [Paracoccus]ODT60986.1 MAG: hypothetical protein ABS73_03875 [Paracoccus sp. SCN 68-21]
MATLEQLIDEAAKSGGLTALTVWPCAGGFQCNVRRANGKTEGWRCITAAIPSRGIKDALTGPVRVLEPAADAAKDEDIFG